MTYAAGIESIREAALRLAGHAHRTPVVTSRLLDERTGRQVFFKCENLQRAGAFKFRGAFNAIMSLADPVAKRGVVTHSSGNHAGAVALAAQLRGIPAHVVMPTSAPEVKRRAVRGYGAQIVDCGPTLEARTTTAAAVMERTGATLIPPYDHPDVIAGQGTVALEFHEQVPDLHTILVPVSGGGLISGIALATAALAPRTRVVGVEPQGAEDAARSKALGQRVVLPSPSSVADGLLAGLGELTWPVVRDLVERILVVDDADTLREMRWFWERTKLVIEPSAAVGVAALFTEEFRALDARRVGVILSGGNVDFDAYVG